jgi:hypothetical protein
MPSRLQQFRTSFKLELVRSWIFFRTLRVQRAERKYLAKFLSFYEQLPDKRNIFYIFFSSALLHWVKTILAFVPDRVNTVLIGSELTQGELEWLRTAQNRPFHHIPMRVDDKTVWEFLFEVNRHNFGWLDVDCFVLNPNVFDEMASIGDKVSLNSAYSYIGHGGMRVVSTHFLFVNVAIRDAIRRAGVKVSPCTYSYTDNPAGRHVPNVTTKVPTHRQLDLIRNTVLLDEEGLPVPPSMIKEKFDAPVFDTLVMYQLVATALGYPVKFVRCVSGIAGTQESYSDELMHIAAASYFRTLKRYEHYKPERLTDRQREEIFSYYKLLLQFNYLLLSKRVAGLPEEYLRLQEELLAELRRLEIPADGIAPFFRDFLMERAGISEAAFHCEGWRDLWNGKSR